MPQFLRLTTRERVIGSPDDVPATPVAATEAGPRDESPRAALRELLVPAVTSGQPCYVLFSGGRDSSVVLAAATTLARQLGADDPVPVTAIHPDDPSSHESEWQDLVLDHLQVRHRIVRQFHGEQTFLGEAAVTSLAANGLLWPPAVHVQGAFVDGLPPGHLLTGEGGDLVISARRITPFAAMIRARRPRGALREAVALARPRSADRHAAFASISPWLTPAGERLLADALAHDRPEPLAWNRALLAATRSRPQVMVDENVNALLGGLGFPTLSPLGHPRFVAALTREGGRLGLGYRTQMFRRLFGDLLPDEILARRTKASFTTSRMGEREREFAVAWSGAGVDQQHIDVERLRADLLSDDSSPLSALHLHAGWLADHGIPFDGHDA